MQERSWNLCDEGKQGWTYIGGTRVQVARLRDSALLEKLRLGFLYFLVDHSNKGYLLEKLKYET